MTTHNFAALRSSVIGASESQSWALAVEEWEVTGLEEDPLSTGICICGKTGLTYLYTIKNVRNNEHLFPIGSTCVNLFDVEELRISVGALRGLLHLRAEFNANKTIDLAPPHFSRAVLADLWQNGAFQPSNFNRFNEDNDYRFLLDMFNQRRDPTPAQEKKIWVLINRTIRDFVMTDERLD